jgi:hypothetical protein
MTGWIPWLKDLINLIVWLAFAYGLWWKGAAVVEKWVSERSVGKTAIEELKKKIEALEEEKEHFKKCNDGFKTDIATLTGLVKDMGNRMWDFLKK